MAGPPSRREPILPMHKQGSSPWAMFARPRNSCGVSLRPGRRKSRLLYNNPANIPEGPDQSRCISRWPPRRATKFQVAIKCFLTASVLESSDRALLVALGSRESDCQSSRTCSGCVRISARRARSRAFCASPFPVSNSPSSLMMRLLHERLVSRLFFVFYDFSPAGDRF